MSERNPICFKIERGNRETLLNQVVAGFKRAIDSSYYRGGERLPSLKRMAEELGVSIRVPRDAVKRLIAEGYVRARPRVGVEVLSKDERVWKGRVLAVISSAFEGSYYLAMLIGELRRCLVARGYRFSVVTVEAFIPSDSRRELAFSQFDVMLREGADLILAIHPSKAIARRILQSHIPSLAYVDVQRGMGLPEIRGGTFQIDTKTAGRLADEGVRKAVVFRFVPIPSCEENLHAAGIEVEPILVTVKAGNGYLERLHHAAMTAVLGRFASPGDLPDLVIFADDHLAYGGFTALAALKLDIPRRMRVLTMANRGYAPAAPFPYDTILTDPFANAAHLADAVAARLEKRAFDCPCPHATFMPSDAKS